MIASRPRRAAVTGAASGIGRALASILHGRDYSLGLADIDGGRLDAISTELSADCAIVTDVADAADMQAFADAVGAVDVLCLNAGVLSTSMSAPWEAPPEEWNRVLGVNLYGVVNGLRAFLPLLLDRGTPCQVLITASLAGVATWPGGGPYAASKHAVLAVAEQAAQGLALTPVQVTVMCPALVRTAMSDQGDDPFDIAAEGLRAAEEGRFAVVPDAWSHVVRDRATMLVDGRPPTPPLLDR